MLGLGIDIPSTQKGITGFSPMEVGDLSYYFDANNTTGWSITAGRIALIKNRGLQTDYDFAQPTSLNSPTWSETGGSNNKAYVGFDSSNSASMFTSDDGGDTVSDVPLGDYYTIFAVSYLNTTTSPANYGLACMRKTGLNRWLFRQVLGGTDQVQLSNWDASAIKTDGTADTTMAETWVIAIGKVYDDGGTDTVEAYVNNTTNTGQAIANALVDTVCALSIGKGNLAGQYMDGYISEFGVYNKALTTGQQERLTNYLSNKYAITI